MVETGMMALAQRMADEAGVILRRYWRAPVAMECKADASSVTQADREVETALRAMIEATFPQHGIIGEEFGNLREDAPWQWVLDPIDGTRSFIGGYPLFTTLIALVKDGVPVLGLIDQPVMRERWLGMAGRQTTLNGQPIATRACPEPERAVLATTSMDYFNAEQSACFQSFKRQCGHSVLGGDAYAYAMLASGRMDVVLDAGLKPYDFCALKPVIEGAGGVITDWEGQPLTLRSDGRILAAGTAALHRAALSGIPSSTG